MKKLNYKHLHYFQAVAHEGNLTRAAEKLNLSQSALSVQLKTLEDQLGHALFERRGRALHLTETGRMALDHADAIFAIGDDLLGTLEGQGASRPVLRIGAMATLSRNFQIGLFRDILSDEPDVDIELRSAGPDTLLKDLADLSLDLVLLDTAAGRRPEDGTFHSHRLSEQQVSLIGTPDRIGKDRSMTELLAEQPVIVPGAYGSIRTGFDALVQRLGLKPRIAAEVDDMAMMRLLARDGFGVAVLPAVVVQDELTEGKLIEAHKLPEVFESFYAVTVERRYPHPLVTKLLARQG